MQLKGKERERRGEEKEEEGRGEERREENNCNDRSWNVRWVYKEGSS